MMFLVRLLALGYTQEVSQVLLHSKSALLSERINRWGRSTPRIRPAGFKAWPPKGYLIAHLC